MSSRTLRVLSAAAGVPLLLGGAGAGVAAGLQAAGGGSFATPEHRFTTPTAAIKTDEIAVGAESAHAGDPDPDIGEAAQVTITVRAADPATPIFVGIGPKAQVERYLRGHTPRRSGWRPRRVRAPAGSPGTRPRVPGPRWRCAWTGSREWTCAPRSASASAS